MGWFPVCRRLAQEFAIASIMLVSPKRERIHLCDVDYSKRGGPIPSCWSVHSLADLKLAPFHVLASEGVVHSAKDHVWHMETLAGICGADPELLLATRTKQSISLNPLTRRKASSGGNN
jgi:hypothetical protein